MRQLGLLQSGEPVFDRPRSHLEPEVEGRLIKALPNVNSKNRKTIEEEVRFPNPIGYSRLIETTPEDEIVYVKRHHRKGYSRLVVGRKGKKCNTLYLKLIKAKKDNGYILITSFIGSKTPPEPAPGSDSVKLKRFWSNHALVFEESLVIPGTLTSKIPLEYKIG